MREFWGIGFPQLIATLQSGDSQGNSWACHLPPTSESRADLFPKSRLSINAPNLWFSWLGKQSGKWRAENVRGRYFRLKCQQTLLPRIVCPHIPLMTRERKKLRAALHSKCIKSLRGQQGRSRGCGEWRWTQSQSGTRLAKAETGHESHWRSIN